MDIQKQLEIIRRGVVEIISEEELKKKLEESAHAKRPLVIKAGFDPTAPDIHLGHTVLLTKLKHFQQLGHMVIFLIGDFTARIGDPTGQSKVRKVLSDEEIKDNAKTYQSQAAKILDIEKLKTVFNSGWFDEMKGLEFGRMLTHYTATRLLERDDFSQRIKEGKPLYMSEFIYPILQGYDSVVLKADIEIGGTDQKFNLIVGRDMQRDYGLPPQVIITMPLLEGTDGVQKMSKSLGNYIGISEAPGEIFGKVMSISDELMHKYYELLTDEDMASVKALHPKEAKVRLAQILITQYYSAADAQAARTEFERVFSAKELPQAIAEYHSPGTENILTVLVRSGLVKSGNEARRLLAQGAVAFNDIKITQESYLVSCGGVLKVGTRRFLKVVL